MIERHGTVTLEAYGNPSYCGLHVDVGFKYISTLTYSAELRKFITIYVISEVRILAIDVDRLRDRFPIWISA